jgi:hypothetical protein
MNKNPSPVSNAHHSKPFRLDAQPDLSVQFAHFDTYNIDLTQMRDLDRYKTAYSSKLNIYDPARIVSPANYFGVKFIEPNPEGQRFSPAGMDMVNSRKQTGSSFTKPFKKFFPQNL